MSDTHITLPEPLFELAEEPGSPSDDEVVSEDKTRAYTDKLFDAIFNTRYPLKNLLNAVNYEAFEKYAMAIPLDEEILLAGYFACFLNHNPSFRKDHFISFSLYGIEWRTIVFTEKNIYIFAETNSASRNSDVPPQFKESMRLMTKPLIDIVSVNTVCNEDTDEDELIPTAAAGQIQIKFKDNLHLVINITDDYPYSTTRAKSSLVDICNKLKKHINIQMR